MSNMAQEKHNRNLKRKQKAKKLNAQRHNQYIKNKEYLEQFKDEKGNLPPYKFNEEWLARLPESEQSTANLLMEQDMSQLSMRDKVRYYKLCKEFEDTYSEERFKEFHENSVTFEKGQVENLERNLKILTEKKEKGEELTEDFENALKVTEEIVKQTPLKAIYKEMDLGFLGNPTKLVDMASTLEEKQNGTAEFLATTLSYEPVERMAKILKAMETHPNDDKVAHARFSINVVIINSIYFLISLQEDQIKFIEENKGYIRETLALAFSSIYNGTIIPFFYEFITFMHENQTKDKDGIEDAEVIEEIKE